MEGNLQARSPVRRLVQLSEPNQRRPKLYQTDGASDKDLQPARNPAQRDLSDNKKGLQAAALWSQSYLGSNGGVRNLPTVTVVKWMGCF